MSYNDYTAYNPGQQQPLYPDLGAPSQNFQPHFQQQPAEELGRSIYGSPDQKNFFDGKLQDSIKRAKKTADKIIGKTFQPEFKQAIYHRCDSSPVWSWGSSWFSPTTIASNNHTVNNYYGSSKEDREQEEKGMSSGQRVALFVIGGGLAALGSWLIGTNLASLEEAKHQLGSNAIDRKDMDTTLQFTLYKRSELDSPHGRAIRRILDLENAIFSRIRRNAQMNLFGATSIVATGILGVGAGLAGSYVLVAAAGVTGLATGCTWLVYKGYRYASTEDKRDAEEILNEYEKLADNARKEYPEKFLSQPVYAFNPQAVPVQGSGFHNPYMPTAPQFNHHM